MQIRRSFLIFAVLFLTALLAGACEDKAGLATAETDSNPPPAIPVSVMTVEPETVQCVADEAGRAVRMFEPNFVSQGIEGLRKHRRCHVRTAPFPDGPGGSGDHGDTHEALLL